MKDLNKHRKISAFLHLLHGMFMMFIGYIIFVISSAFTACTTEALDKSPNNCLIVSAVLFGIPLLISLLTISAFYTYGVTAKKLLKLYAFIAAISLTPTGLLAGFHTQKLLKITANTAYNKSSNLTGANDAPSS